MAWYTDEQYMMISDSREKKSIAASAFKQRTHCGKGGSVKFPSDYLTKKERDAMNGEVKSYRMNEPISWEEFSEWPTEHKVTYIKKLRERFGVNDKYIADMFGIACNIMLAYFREFGLDAKTACDDNFEREKFFAWRTGANTDLVQENATASETENAEELDLTAPMSWDKFKELPDEKKIQYVKWIRETFEAPDSWIAKALDAAQTAFGNTIRRLNIGAGKGHMKGKAKGAWNKEGFMNWCGMTEVSVVKNPSVKPQEAVEAENEVAISEVSHTDEVVRVEETPCKTPTELNDYLSDYRKYVQACAEKKRQSTPVNGNMTFECRAVDALEVIHKLLGDANVRIKVEWEVVG